MTTIGTRLLKIKVGSTEYTAQVLTAKIVAVTPSGAVTYAEAAAGGAKEYQLHITAVQDPGASGIWGEVWDNAGDTVAVTVNPHGVTTGTAETPLFTGNCIIAAPDGDFIGGDASPDVSGRQVFSAVWPFTAKPTKDTSGTF